MRQHMKEDINDLLNGLETRERQVMVLRYGLKGTPLKSLEEIGRLFHLENTRKLSFSKTVIDALLEKGIIIFEGVDKSKRKEKKMMSSN
ncbi:hypothetical protein REPUB_Repub18cG0141000 [Reevesia pubescens]